MAHKAQTVIKITKNIYGNNKESFEELINTKHLLENTKRDYRILLSETFKEPIEAIDVDFKLLDKVGSEL